MKTTGRTLGCRSIRREIEEAGEADSLSLSVNDHLRTCSACEVFYDEQTKLRQLVSSLGTVAAPADFDFRLRARLAGEKARGGHPFAIGNLSFGSRSAVFAAALLLTGSAILFVSLRGRQDGAVANNSVSGTPAVQNSSVESSPLASAVGPDAVPAPIPSGSVRPNTEDASLKERRQPAYRRRAEPRPAQLALAGNARLTSTDMASTQASILKPEDFTANTGRTVFPIDASAQPLKVSLDNGRGSSKTISLPGVSFGSQRVLTQNPTPLLAAARGSW